MGSAQQTHWPSLHHIHIFSLKKTGSPPLTHQKPLNGSGPSSVGGQEPSAHS